MLKWKEEYCVGVELIDEQHKRLFEIGNSAYELMNNNIILDKYDRIVQILEDLRQYAAYHFKCEEEYMLSISYKKYFSHKVEHEDLIKKLNAINFEEIDENQDQYIKDLLAFIFDWILDHILTKDKLIKTI
jgi:hemerythrin